jgi:hypothetical protein
MHLFRCTLSDLCFVDQRFVKYVNFFSRRNDLDVVVAFGKAASAGIFVAKSRQIYLYAGGHPADLVGGARRRAVGI